MLDGFTLTGGGDVLGSAIKIEKGGPIIENSIIKNNSNAAVHVRGTLEPSFKNSLFYDNPVSAIRVNTGYPPEFVNCTANNGIGIENPVEPNDVILKILSFTETQQIFPP